MKSDIEGALAPLVGLPLWSAGRSLDLEWFHFGSRRKVRDRGGKEIEVGDFAIHTQCAWRIIGPDGIAVASRDRFTPRGSPDEIPEDFDCSQPGTTLCDERMEALLERQGESLFVEHVVVGDWGSFTLALRGDFKLEIFPDDSSRGEHWRLFKPRVEQHHFVVTGSGIQE
jgi:hypothetical protein